MGYSAGMLRKGFNDALAIKDKVKANNEHIEQINGILSDLDAQYARGYKQYAKGNVPESVYEEDVKRIKSEQKKWNAEKVKLENANNEFSNMIKDIETDKRTHSGYEKKVSKIEDDNVRYDLIHKVIEKVELTKDGNKFIIKVFPRPQYLYSGNVRHFYTYYSRGGQQHLAQVFDSGYEKEEIEILKRF